MRFVLATSLLLGLAACGGGGPPAEAPPPQPAAMTPPPAAAPPPPMAGFEGHYVGNAAPGKGRTCAREENYDFTVADNKITGTLAGPAGHGAPITGKVGPDGHATLMLPHGGRVTGMIDNGTFTGHSGRPCLREVTASATH